MQNKLRDQSGTWSWENLRQRDVDVRLFLCSSFYDFYRREAQLLDEHAMDTSRLQTTHDAQREARHALYDQELSALQAQKSMLIERLEEAQSEIDQTRETNHS